MKRTIFLVLRLVFGLALLLSSAAVAVAQNAVPVTVHVFTKDTSEIFGAYQSAEVARAERQKAVKEIMALLTKGVKVADAEVPPSPANGIKFVDKPEDAIVTLEVMSNGLVAGATQRLQVREVTTVVTSGNLTTNLDEQGDAEPSIATRFFQWIQDNKAGLKK